MFSLPIDTTKREYFAALFLQALISPLVPYTSETVANIAVESADALLAVLEKYPSYR